MRANVLQYFWAEVAGEWNLNTGGFLGLVTKRVNRACVAGCVYIQDGKLQCSLLGVYFYGLLFQVLLICIGFRFGGPKLEVVLQLQEV